jgi:hypothetical protein
MNIEKKIFKRCCILTAVPALQLIFTVFLWADVTVNILAVNATDEKRSKSVEYVLPADITATDILDPAGLKVDYKVDAGAYYVHGDIELAPKESKTLKVRLRDIWKIDEGDVEKVKTQIDNSVALLKGTEYEQQAGKKKQELLNRIDYILGQQQQYADNATKRIERFKVYEAELAKIRSDAVSIHYWRSLLPDDKEKSVIRLVIEADSPSTNSKTTYMHKHYLPGEVKPENIVDAQGFDVGYDDARQQLFLSKEEEFQPGETKKYSIDIDDVWTIPQTNIENLKNRTRYAYKLLETTQYIEQAKFLVESIKDKLAKIEESQAQEKDINQHISDFHANGTLYVKAEKDVEDLEDLLNAARENLERSLLKNVLQKLKALKTIREIAASIFKKPQLNTAWRIIVGIVIFVGIITMTHFIIWGKRSREFMAEEEATSPPPTESGEKKE